MARKKSKGGSKFQFDAKKFLVEKGERLVLGISATVMALMLITSGISAIGGNSASANSAALKKLADTASQRMNASAPPAELSVLPPDLSKTELVLVDKDWFPCDVPFFDRTGISDRKWRQPKVLAPEEFAAEVVRGAVQAYDLLLDGDRVTAIGILQTRSQQQSQADTAQLAQNFRRYQKTLQAKQLQDLIRNRYPGGMAAAGAGPAFGGGGGGGGGGGELMNRRGGPPRGGFLGAGSMAPGQGAATALLRDEGEMEIKFININELDRNPGKPAQTIIPVRMAIIDAAFPFKAQLEAFRRALRFDSIEQMMADPQAAPEFMGFEVERRDFGPDGKQIEEWTPLDIQKTLRDLRIAAKGTEPEDSKLVRYGMIIRPNRLVVPRPKLIPHQKYPDLVLSKLRQQVETIEKRPDAIAPPPPPRKTRFEEDTFDIFSGEETENLFAPGSQPTAQAPGAPAGGGPAPRRAARFGFGDEGGEGPAEPSARGGTAAPAKVVWPPEYCLLRFLDVTVQPGHSYEYRLRVRMANPNYKNEEKAVAQNLTTEQFLTANEWTVVSRKFRDTEVPLRVAVPDELLYYAIDDTARPGFGIRPSLKADATAVQLHRWLDFLRINAEDKESTVPVGDWSILERLPIHRGEYVGRTESVEVPVWKPSLDRFTLASPPDARRTSFAFRRQQTNGVPVDFETDPITEAGSVLLDFEGGKRTTPEDPKTVLDEGPLEVLILGSNGKLIVHNSRHDTMNPARTARYDDWRTWLQTVRTKASPKRGGDDVFDADTTAPRGRKRPGNLPPP